MKLSLPELHYHSITAHVPCVTVPLTAVAYACFLYTGVLVYNVAHIGLTAVTFLSFFAVVSSGYLEREHKYVNWTPLFIRKLLLSGLHLIALLFQAYMLIRNGVISVPYGTPYALVTIGLQTLLMAGLTYLGVVTAQGRIGGSVAYKNDPEFALSYDIVKIIKETQPDPLKEAPYDRF
ncbi:MAG: hypothetical protein A2293_05820 [Elusimicrobia bacterium RIFOXYB2_FULL_49_7]|nr:MAG: hypothetical protein A2293_05820 [Elusimicrobia bacterium RIFOXYB2_FULL_49_7]